MRAAVLIVAAGRGHRLGGEVPKQYLPLAGRSALARGVARFLSEDAVTVLRVVIHPYDYALYAEAMSGLDDPRLGPTVEGGATRAASVLAGLEALAADAPDAVLIHDAARPFVSADLIRRTLDALAEADGAAAALPVVDALWRAEDGNATEPVPRDCLWRAQTPQGFRFDAILAAHRAHGADALDDVEVARRAGLSVRLIEGSEENFKITTPADLARALKALMPE